MNLAVVFGGKSSEHDVSVITGVMTVNAAAARHNVLPLYINGDVEMYTSKKYDSVDAIAAKVKGKKAAFVKGGVMVGRKKVKLDCVVIACHGRYGEDGCLQGMLEMFDLPYVSCGVRASAVGMDKWLFKQVISYMGLPTAPFVGFFSYERNRMADKCEKLGYPLIVKPSSLGSSIGVGKACCRNELINLLDAAALWDDRIIVEKAFEDFDELNCAAIGFEDKVIVSEVEQPYGYKDILDFDDKYRGTCKGRMIPASVSDKVRDEVREMTKLLYKQLGCGGIIRVDFIRKDGIFVNEINTVPGSLAEYLFSCDGITFPGLIDALIENALRTYKCKKELKFSYDSDLLKRKKIYK